jgi:DNA-binding FadR family transcriptional regulator
MLFAASRCGLRIARRLPFGLFRQRRAELSSLLAFVLGLAREGLFALSVNVRRGGGIILVEMLADRLCPMSARPVEESFVSARALEMVTQVRLPGPLESFGRPEQVSRQLEAAIGIGILNSGERLPPEAVLAEHLGVSPLTLRQAIGLLRSKGLVDTRRGRSGGSYVSGQVSISDEQIDDRLRVLGTDDLRDLIDIAASNAGAAARLAALRSDDQDLRRVRDLARRFANASLSGELRLADSRFHIGLGVAAQSRRLTALLIQIQAELTPLSWGTDWKGRQDGAVREHAAIISAMGEGLPDEAERLARAHFEEEGLLLINRHLALLTPDSETA